MTSIETNFCMDMGEVQFESEASRDSFLENPVFRFDFNIENVDDKEGVARIFGSTDVTPVYPSGVPKFVITHLEASDDDETVAICSIELQMEFKIVEPFEDFMAWIEGEGETWRFTGRIECDGETALLSSEREEYEDFEEVV